MYGSFNVNRQFQCYPLSLLMCVISNYKLFHHQHHLSLSCHCWQMAFTTFTIPSGLESLSSSDCHPFSRCHLAVSFSVFLSLSFLLWVTTLHFPSWTTLKSITMDTASKEQETKCRITFGWQAFGRAERHFQKQSNPLVLKRQVYDQYILLMVTNGAETWNLAKKTNAKAKNYATGPRKDYAQHNLVWSQNSRMDQATNESQGYDTRNHQ